MKVKAHFSMPIGIYVIHTPDHPTMDEAWSERIPFPLSGSIHVGLDQDPNVPLHLFDRITARMHAILLSATPSKNEDRRRTILQRSLPPRPNRMEFLAIYRFNQVDFAKTSPIEYGEMGMGRTGIAPMNFSLNSRSGPGSLPGLPPPRPR